MKFFCFIIRVIKMVNWKKAMGTVMNLICCRLRVLIIRRKLKEVIYTGCNEDISRTGTVEIGEYTTIANVRILTWNSSDIVKIGKFCSIASGATILGGGNHRIRRVTSYPLEYVLLHDMKKRTEDCSVSRGPTLIGNDVWVGINAIVLSGVTIGDGAVVGAGAVVSKDVAPYAIAAGNPAKIIGYRFSEKQIQDFLLIRWWNWDINKIKDNIYLFGDVDKFIKTFKVGKT